MMYNYCTLFDYNFFTRGLALYQSLCRHSSVDFHLYILAMDSEVYDLLNQLDLPRMTVISEDTFETDVLKELKKTRARNEYCWTCTPSLLCHCFDQYKLENCTYLDADIYFFSDPSVLIKEMESDASVLITKHRYTPKYDQTETSGIYCVQFMTFNRTQESQKILKWWQEQCNIWCFARCEDGKFGDQKYLDTWPEQFKRVHILQHKGGGIAPWNVQQYAVVKNKDCVLCIDNEENTAIDLVFYHFHGLRFHTFGKVTFGTYDLNDDVKQVVYKAYLRHLDAIYQTFKDSHDIVPHETLKVESWWTVFLKELGLKKEEKHTFFKKGIL